IHRQRGPRRALGLAALAGAAASLFSSAEARAQADINPPIPNVLLLIDTSGSMERMIDGTLPEANAANACNPGTATPMNRWATLVSVLTGPIESFSCAKTVRDATFSAEYSIGGVAPYDLGYYLPFHRILSHGCTIGPGTLGTNWWDWPNTAFKQHDYSGTT